MRQKKPASVFPDDDTLRDHGFIVVARPTNKYSLWCRNRILYTHQEALSLAAAEREELLNKLEQAYS